MTLGRNPVSRPLGACRDTHAFSRVRLPLTVPVLSGTFRPAEPAGPTLDTPVPPLPAREVMSVNALLFFLGAALAADPDPVTQGTFFNAQSYFDAPALAQSPGGTLSYDDDPLSGANPQTYAPGSGSPLV